MRRGAAEFGCAAPCRAYRASRGWQIAWGVLLIIAGVLAVAMPFVAALATAFVFAWALVIGGVAELAYAVHTRHEPGFGWKLVAGIITLLLGILVLVAPLAGAASLGLLVGIFLFVGGIARTILAFRLRPHRGWGWVLVDGIISIVVGVLVAAGWPAYSIAFIGILTGLWLLWAGAWRVALWSSRAA